MFFSTRPLAIDLFSGVGGLSLGLEMSGFDIIGACEMEPTIACAYKYNFPLTAVFCCSAEGFNWSLHKESCITSARLYGHDVYNKRLAVDLVAGGSPCQGFSRMGKRSVTDPRSQGIFQVLRVASDCDAPYFLIENVPDLLGEKFKDLLDGFKSESLKKGYNLSFHVIPATWFGVPQYRERLFIIGSRCGEIDDISYCPSLISAHEAIGDFPDFDDFPELIKSDKLCFRLNPNHSEYARRMRGDRSNPFYNDLSHWRFTDYSTINNVKRSQNNPSTQTQISKIAPGETNRSLKITRLHENHPAITLRGGGGGSDRLSGGIRPVHYKYHRKLVVRECARLHSFPDWFTFSRPISWGVKEIGNAVPPLLGKGVGDAILKHMNLNPSASNICFDKIDEYLIDTPYSNHRIWEKKGPAFVPITGSEYYRDYA